jgi:hypothetical protein
MGSHSLPLDSEAADPDWRALEDVLDEIAEAAKSTLSAGDFYRFVLDRIVPAAGVSGGAIWTAANPGELCLEYQIDVADSRGATTPEVEAGRQELVEEVLSSGQPRVVPPLPVQSADSSGANRTDCWVILYPFRVSPEKPGVIELVQRRAIRPERRSDYLRLLAAVVELCDDFHRQHELSLLRQRERAWCEFERFALRAHRSLDVNETAFAIANDARRVIGCDRVSVLTCRRGKCRAVAASGVDALERRGKLVRTLELLAARVAAGGDPLWYRDGSGDLTDEIERPLEAYLDESHARVVAIVPLRAPGTESDGPARRVIGVLVAEQFQTSAGDAELRERVAAVASHSAVALANALAHRHMPLARASRALARLRWLAEPRQLPKTAAVLLALAAIVCGLAFIPADFEIEARGELQPEVRREVFASDDATVSELPVDPGRKIRAGQAVVVLRKPQLDLEIRRVAGEIETARKKLAAVQAERLSNAPLPPESRRDAHQLSADEEELKELLKGLADQREILERQRKDLVVRSPIDGEVLTWKLKELLEARPVERGQAMLTVADLEGPWVVELRLADHRTGHVLAARDELKKDLDVSFALAAQPGTSYEGRISQVALSTDVDQAAGPTVLVTVAFDRGKVAPLRPGAGVLARIHCGRRALGYVWLHDLFEFVQSHWWW